MVSSAEVEKYKADGQITSGVRLRPEVVTELREKMERFFEAQPGVDQDYAAKKGKGGKLTPWHQDGHYWPIRPLATVTAWIAIDDVDTANGCLRVIPGSHSAQELQDHYTEDSPDVVLNQALEVGDDRFGKPRDVELKAGEFSIHDVYLIHGAAKNDSGRRRAGLVFRYMPTTSHFDRDLACKQAQEMNVPDLSNRQLHLVSGVDRSGKNDVRRN
jgi:phytanoyl-CoA hydroxylase